VTTRAIETVTSVTVFRVPTVDELVHETLPAIELIARGVLMECPHLGVEIEVRTIARQEGIEVRDEVP
jgi:hypothetical protein